MSNHRKRTGIRRTIFWLVLALAIIHPGEAATLALEARAGSPWFLVAIALILTAYHLWVSWPPVVSDLRAVWRWIKRRF